MLNDDVKRKFAKMETILPAQRVEDPYPYSCEPILQKLDWDKPSLQAHLTCAYMKPPQTQHLLRCNLSLIFWFQHSVSTFRLRRNSEQEHPPGPSSTSQPPFGVKKLCLLRRSEASPRQSLLPCRCLIGTSTSSPFVWMEKWLKFRGLSPSDLREVMQIFGQRFPCLKN